VREARRLLDDAAARAGRPRPALVVSQAAVLGSGDVARAAARVVVGHHLGQPNYQRNMVRMGFTEDEARMPPPDRLVEALVATGDEAALRARLEEMLAAGADHVALIPIAPDGTQPDPAVIRACAPRLDPASARGYPR
jgi:ABC-type sugar transport system substrate-binding protein